MVKIGENWTTNFQIPSFNFKIDETKIWDRFNKRITSEFVIVYLLNSTGSMGSYLAARDQCINISKQFKVELPELDFNFWSFIL